jgi:hypothetical protein
MNLLCKQIIVAKSMEMKTGCNVRETAKVGTKRAVLSVFIIIIITIMIMKMKAL